MTVSQQTADAWREAIERCRAYNRRTAKLRPQGDAWRDKLIRERLRARREER